ncbi:hypothetical protein BDU57DRAFT_558784 [Ampelomyces quisqualis]|uniref:SWI-SNF chromatin-remodeling complex protein n=1 Tax=Ampelomyces quisqualis TaxID=50730 RepID=A0A6A5QGK8_AMPQU|nr:hypothetical protein BDU57DRAFT_558784 [Ampelomyces quisqualis]
MSGPYRFDQESAKSPLDRAASPFSAGQPVSFKTNVNRAKTKKWVTAKKNAYDGDDWGDYDEYDEYGAAQEAPPPPPAGPAPSQRYYAGGQPQRTYADRSFTEPLQQGPPGSARRNSFEAGEEHRAFSASMPPPPHGHGQQQPPPLQTLISPMPADINASPSRTHFPPRKSSFGQAESPTATSPRPRTGSHPDKPLPFVRPADIYKRVDEERERERASLDSSRPSLDSLSSRPKDALHSPTSDGGRMLQPLETVAERKSEYLPAFDSTFADNDKQPAPSAFQSQAPGSHPPAVSPPSDQGFRSVVDQAFTRNDDQRSVPPTPTSKDDDSNMSRSNTGSTMCISPIMSRVPSGAASAVKRNQAAGEGSTPVIAEEPSDTTAAVSQPTSMFAHGTSHAAPPKPFTDHSRNISNSSLPRSGLATPTRGDSPARSPLIALQKDLPAPRAAQIATDSPDQSHAMDGGLSGPSAAYASREADIASAARSGQGSATSGLGAAEIQSQDAFLKSHVGQSPTEDAFPRSRSQSPSKSRVQALAGKFGDVSTSRRGSTQSNTSRHSIQSWEKSQGNSRAASPTKGSPGKPSSPVKEFRPHLPGQWESYATTAATPLDQGDRDRSLGFGTDNASASLENADLTPTTPKRSVDEVAFDSGPDPIAALKSAGAAMAQSFKATIGVDDTSSDFQSRDAQQTKSPAHGDMYMPRPLHIPPTPPAKDTPTNADTNTPVQQKRPEFFPQLSTQPSADDQESDRLRKEIVASLTPVTTGDLSRTSLQPASTGTNRDSSILPAEYDSYWADGDDQSVARHSQDVEQRNLPAILSAVNAAPAASQTNELPKTSLLNRFSWENNTPQLAAPAGVAKSVTVPEPMKMFETETIPSPTSESAAEEERQQRSKDLPDPYLGPGHTFTVTKPDLVTESELSPRSPTTPIDHGSLASPTREHTRSPGLHVVNSAVDPEAVDLPPRLSADHSAAAQSTQHDLNPSSQLIDRETANPAISTSVHAPEPSSPMHPQNHAREPPTSPTSGKPLGAREIATINPTAERIATYNQTREHWATHDHGLGGWLSSAIDANPELANKSAPLQPPSGSNAAFDRRVASRQLEAKGKDLLHTANVLSGKGLTSAKGLFAKGKSRFGREKGPHSGTDSMPSSRDASEESEFIASRSQAATSTTTTSERPVSHYPADTDSAKEDKKKRRFSLTSFHRSSRSRSRPSSIVLPSSNSFFSTMPKGTPPRGLSRILGEDRSRPHSYHAPDSWNFAPASRSASGSHVQSTPPREPSQSRLGILPSPAKSVFSAHDKENEQDIPPVPRIPDTVRLSNDLSHEVLQSVIRYSTPPIPAGKSSHVAQVGPVLQRDVVSESSSRTGQWPLLNNSQHAASVSRNDSGEGIKQTLAFNLDQDTMPLRAMPIQEDIDEDDLPPRLSYEPITSSKTADETENLPSYLVYSQLNVSDDEDYNNDNGLLRAKDSLLRAKPVKNRALVSPLLQSAELAEDQGGTHRAPDERQDDVGNMVAYRSSERAASISTWTQKDGPLASRADYDASFHAELRAMSPRSMSESSNGSTVVKVERSSRGATESHLTDDGSRVSSPLAESNVAAREAHVRDHTSSPEPVWFTHGDLQFPKTRTQSVAEARHQMDTRHGDGDGVAAKVPQLGAETAQGALLASAYEGTSCGPRRVSAAPFQVVLAAEENAAEKSSFASWDDSAVAHPVSGTSQPSDMRDESDLVTPVAQVPRIVRNGHQAINDKAEESNHQAPSHTARHQQQQASDLTVPGRPKSMLSMISSMVSEDGTPISPSSSNAGRSTPSTIRRMQRDSSGKSAFAAVEIPEESMTSNGDRTPTTKDDDYDLYADHNGVVKDLCDERGQPFRVTHIQTPNAQGRLEPTNSGVAGAATTSDARFQDGSTYSTERPMSFISGPTDQDGRPQDQLNLPLTQGSVASRSPVEQLAESHQRFTSPQSSTNYSAGLPDQTVQSSSLTNSQRNASQRHPIDRPPVSSNSQFQANGEPVSETARSQNSTDAKPSQQPNAAPSSSHTPVMNANNMTQDQRQSGASPGPAMPQRPAVQGQVMTPDHDFRFSRQLNGPRNEYAYQQQMMQVSGQYHHPRGVNDHANHAGSQTPPKQELHPQDKSSSFPKLSAVFKGLGGKLQGNTQPAARPPNPALRPDTQPTWVDPTRIASSYSGVSVLQREQTPNGPGGHPASSVPRNRPPSNGAESHPTSSRVDLRKPASPMPFQGIPPRIMPQGAPTHGGKLQPYRASTSGVPETGKKKRFSTLGNIFSRSSGAQPKMSKEQKKAQKAQEHSTAPRMQSSHWPQQQQEFRSQQHGMPQHPGQFPPGQWPPRQYPSQQIRQTGPQIGSTQLLAPANFQSAHGVDPYGRTQHYQITQPGISPQQQAQGVTSEQSSAYLRTRQLAEQHQAQKAQAPVGQLAGPGGRPGTHVSNSSNEQPDPQSRQISYGPPPDGYYNPNPTPSILEQGAHNTTKAARLLAEQQRPQVISGQDASSAPGIELQPQYQQLSARDEEAYKALQVERQRLGKLRLQFDAERSQAVGAEHAQPQQGQSTPEVPAYGGFNEQAQRKQLPDPQAESLQSTHVQRLPVAAQNMAQSSREEFLRANQERQQFEQQLCSQQYADRAQLVVNHRSVSGPLPIHDSNALAPYLQHHVSNPAEPQYDTPQIPAAYNPVSGAFISPRDREQQSHYVPPQQAMSPIQYDMQYPMPSLSPQVSAQSQQPPKSRTHSDSSVVSALSPIASPAQDFTDPQTSSGQRGQKPRMSSISEVHQGGPERPWHLNFPEGATEQEIVRARQRQFMQQQFTAQQQQHAERVANSSSPRVSSHSQSPAQSPAPVLMPSQQGGGFKELLPRSSHQPYQQSPVAQLPNAAELAKLDESMQPIQAMSIHSIQAVQPGAYPLPMSSGSVNATSPVNPLADTLSAPSPPPKSPNSPMRAPDLSQHRIPSPSIQEQDEPSPPQEEHYHPPPPAQDSQYRPSLEDEPPPSYDGLGMPSGSLEKSRQEQMRPPNIVTDRASAHRPRQASIGILQHPQPASMGASPQRSSADMGAESLRRQLLQQDEHARMERIQRVHMRRAESEREKAQRDAARARARELERSVSGGASVGSIRSVTGSRNGGQPGWQRRGSSTRQVFELPAVEDDEPAMRATSYPGQEWVPSVWTDD